MVVGLVGGSGRGTVSIIGVVGNGCAAPSVSLEDAGSMGGGGNGSVSTSSKMGLGVPVGCKSGDNLRLDLSLTRVFLHSPTQISRFPRSKEPNQSNDAASCYSELLPSKTVRSVLAHPAFQPFVVSVS